MSLPTWSCALAQHPMSLIIEEDEGCAERTPPWGAPSVEAYDERFAGFLAAMEGHPELRAGFDISGVELERLAGRRPDLVERMRGLVRAGRLAFYNGTWSQPHLHLFGAEANVRQLELGCAAFRRLVGYPVRTHAAQEADAHEQLPQLLRAFGFRFAVPPGFYSTLEFQGPHELVHLSTQGLRFVHGEEFTEWVGLDGSTIPLYLPQPGPVSPEREARAGLLHVPGLRRLLPRHDRDRRPVARRAPGRTVRPPRRGAGRTAGGRPAAVPGAPVERLELRRGHPRRGARPATGRGPRPRSWPPRASARSPGSSWAGSPTASMRSGKRSSPRSTTTPGASPPPG